MIIKWTSVVYFGAQVNKPLVVIVGPTASGKSALAMEVARRFNGEIICADSRTVYKGMDIGTAKPSKEDQAEVRHHLLDVVEPGEQFTAADFKHLATKAISDINSRGKLPVIVGGTGLYVDAILFDYEFGKSADPEQRALLQEMTIEELQQICTDRQIKLPVNSLNKRHLIRAIELGGLLKQEKKLKQNTIVVGIAPDKEVLRTRITRRVAEMIKGGVLEEMRSLAQQSSRDNEAMTGNIYRIFSDIPAGDEPSQSAVEQVIRADMALAKRQMTWFKRNPAIIWSDNPAELLTKIAHFLSSQKK